MAKTHLTKRAIEAATYDGKDNSKDVRWDDEVTGFGLRLYPSGKKAFLVKYRDTTGTQCLLTLGDFGVLTLDQARALAREKLVDVAKGASPVEERREAQRGDTVRDLCEHFRTHHVKAPTIDKPNGLASAYDVERRLDKTIIPAWGSRKVASINDDDMRELYANVVKRGRVDANGALVGGGAMHEANRVRALVSKLWNYGRVHKFVLPTQMNPTVGVVAMKEKSRERYVSEQEMPRLFAAIEQADNVFIRGAILLYLFSAARKNELLTAQWKDYSEQAKILLCRNTKNGTDMTYPLSDEAVEILNSLPRLDGNPYLFPGRVPGMHVVNPYKTWGNILKTARIDGVHIHDLRRTAASYMVQSGVPLEVIGALLNHRSDKTTRIYARTAPKQTRDAVDRHGKALSTIRRRATAGSVNVGEDV